ncbi:carboxymuconolactone decarboxylase [Mycobacterium sp. 852002-50816_SCH5313054-b]|uniref:carboxymuconolactone decarboxylase family protein n=1 Tax=Mycobacterium sp. 852002-50816_SCH5313054-b TaxID=1834092 RepID=UPI0008008B4B|nr:carboxymuconolactone decarboxylase family protein [Mycobacterium sp. 852002-50816_SCH5313054-b]OBF47158.1 carboxymuconolactone decarboxylase [Mycobacterium sp. 852002-50816_SCH5313054-b]
MSDHTAALGGRLPLADPAALLGAQRELFDTMTSAVVPWADDTGFQSTTDDGRLIGPFNPMLLNPAMTSVSSPLLLGEREHTSLSTRVREVVILAVGAVWRSDYELYAHSAAARKVGISDDAIRVLATGGIPDDLSEDEKIAAELTRQLSTRHRVDETLYRQAENRFGKKGLTDIAILIGIYHAVCTTLNLFEIPAPHE